MKVLKIDMSYKKLFNKFSYIFNYFFIFINLLYISILGLTFSLHKTFHFSINSSSFGKHK